VRSTPRHRDRIGSRGGRGAELPDANNFSPNDPRAHLSGHQIVAWATIWRRVADTRIRWHIGSWEAATLGASVLVRLVRGVRILDRSRSAPRFDPGGIGGLGPH
jgi:hypothetical protein